MAVLKCKKCGENYGNFMGLDVDRSFPTGKPKKEQKMGLCLECSNRADIDRMYEWKPLGIDSKPKGRQ